MSVLKLKSVVRDVPDFPQEGIIFKDITPILSSPDLFDLAIEQMLGDVCGSKIDKIVGIDARGFIFGSVMADRLKCGFIPIRKAGNFPGTQFKSLMLWNMASNSRASQRCYKGR